jgi:hypothetical protein
MNRQHYYYAGAVKIPDIEAMVATLLDDLILTIDKKTYLDAESRIQKEAIGLFVICNDIFAWGVADAEEITLEELPELFELSEKNKYAGVVQWLCTKRNQQPQISVVKSLKEENYWNDVFENLPPNPNN